MSETPTSPLTAAERKRYQQCVQEISDGLRGSWKAGEALRDVREARLYREDFVSFDEFCQAVHSITQRYANYLIEAVEIKEDIKERSPKMAELLTTETQAREIGNVPRGAQVRVLKAIVRSGEPVTAAAIKAQAESILEQTTDSIGLKAGTIVPARQDLPVSGEAKMAPESKPRDCLGFPIPSAILPLWDRQGEIRELMTEVSRTRKKLREIEESKDPLFKGVNFSAIQSSMQSAWWNIKQGLPHAVCVACKGKQGGCKDCGGTGFINEHGWDVTRSDWKEARLKQIERATA